MDLLQSYDERYKEVSNYLHFLNFVDNLSTRYPWEGQKYDHEELMSYMPSRDMQKILRSNMYMLMYNLIESTFSSMVEAVQTHVNDLKRPLSSYIPEVQLVCAKSCYKNAEAVVKDITKNGIIYIENWNISYSGNVTMGKIVSFMASIKCPPRTTLPRREVEASFEKIKSIRNNLAHGNMSFAQKGSSIVYTDMVKDFENSTQYLREMVINLDDYIKNERYLV